MGKALGIGLGATALLAVSIWDGRQRLQKKRNAGAAKGKRFVIVGGGFGGVEAASELARSLPNAGKDCEIILVDQHGFLLFTPMLTEAVGAQIQPHHVIVPLSSFSPNVRIVKGRVKEIDLPNKRVHFENTDLPAIEADHLVLALGASSDYHGVPGAEGAAYTLKTLEDAFGIRQNALRMVRQAANETSDEKRQALLTFLVAGGGYTGVEAIAALNEMVQDAVKLEPKLRHTPVRMILAEPMERLMQEVTPDLAAYAQGKLEQAGIRVLLKTGIKSVDGDTVTLTNGETIQASTFIWTAGVKANALMEKLPVPKSKVNALRVDGTLALPDHAGVWAIGDCAQVPRPDGKGSYAPTAQNATREGVLVAKNIVRSLRGEPGKPFTYTPIGELALVGRRRGIARVYGLNFSGFIAFAMWRVVYLAKMPSLTQRVRVMSDWVADALLGPIAEIQTAENLESSGGQNRTQQAGA